MSNRGTTGNKLYKLDNSNGDATPFYLGEKTDVYVDVHCSDELFFALAGTDTLSGFELIQGETFGKVYTQIAQLVNGFPIWLNESKYTVEELKEANPGMEFDIENEVLLHFENNGTEFNFLLTLSEDNNPIRPDSIVTSDYNGKVYELSLRVVNYDWN